VIPQLPLFTIFSSKIREENPKKRRFLKRGIKMGFSSFRILSGMMIPLTCGSYKLFKEKFFVIKEDTEILYLMLPICDYFITKGYDKQTSKFGFFEKIRKNWELLTLSLVVYVDQPAHRKEGRV